MCGTGKSKLALTTLIVFDKLHRLDYIEMWDLCILVQIYHAFRMGLTVDIAFNLY